MQDYCEMLQIFVKHLYLQHMYKHHILIKVIDTRTNTETIECNYSWPWPFGCVTKVWGIFSSSGTLFFLSSALCRSLRRLIWTCSCSLFVKNTFLQPTSWANARVSSETVSQWVVKIFSHNSSLEHTLWSDLQTELSLAISTRSRKVAMRMRTGLGKRASQSLHTMPYTMRNMFSPNIRLISVCIKVSSWNSSLGTLRWLGGM